MQRAQASASPSQHPHRLATLLPGAWDMRPDARRWLLAWQSHWQEVCKQACARQDGCAVTAHTMHRICNLQPPLQDGPLVIGQLSRLAIVTCLLPFWQDTRPVTLRQLGRGHLDVLLPSISSQQQSCAPQRLGRCWVGRLRRPRSLRRHRSAAALRLPAASAVSKSAVVKHILGCAA